MIRIRKFQNTVVALLVVYAVLACVGRATLNGQGTLEVFPFFTWTLYTKTPGVKSDFAVRVTAIDGRELPQATYLEDLAGRRVTTGRYGRIQRTVSAAQGGSAEAKQRVHSLVQDTFFPGHSSVGYEIVEREFDVLDRFSSGTLISERVVMTHDSELGLR